MFGKILIANRGEIACRIMRTARRMGIGTVAVCSEADRHALHVKLADEALCIGPAPAALSYLNIDAIIDACQKSGVDAVHPGYGFLSERAAFASACADAGITFIGPNVAAMTAMADKITAKTLAKAAGVSVVPGSIAAIATTAEAEAAVHDAGLPVMIKAAAGGGGKGMRIVRTASELPVAIRQARAEAMAAFGDDRLLVEKFIERPRHIEVQVLGDRHGTIVHLGERECSIQRRHQKLVEEAPSVLLDQHTRERMTSQAVALARAVDYDSAGTVEFVATADQQFFFLEMNTRLQVEHPVTELTTGIDLVEKMILAAAGEPLALEQTSIRTQGWSVETRIIAEDPSRGFAPSTGFIFSYVHPADVAEPARVVRVDSGVEKAATVSVHYDGLLAKLITWAPDRAGAISAQAAALDAFAIDGVNTNLAMLATVMASERWRKGDLSTDFLADEFAGGYVDHRPTGGIRLTFIAVAASIDRFYETRRSTLGKAGAEQGGATRRALMIDGARLDVEWLEGASFAVDGVPSLQIESAWTPADPVWSGCVNGDHVSFVITRTPTGFELRHAGYVSTVEAYAPHQADLIALLPPRKKQVQTAVLHAPMPGLLRSIHVREGQAVRVGDALCSIEAMKMEIAVAAERDGTVATIHAREGDSLSADSVLLEFA